MAQLGTTVYRVRALAAYTASGPGELTFAEGEVFAAQFQDADGRPGGAYMRAVAVGDSRDGLVPADFVTILDVGLCCFQIFFFFFFD